MSRWRLKMYPNGRKLQDTGYVTLFLKDSGRCVATLTLLTSTLTLALICHLHLTTFSPSSPSFHPHPPPGSPRRTCGPR